MGAKNWGQRMLNKHFSESAVNGIDYQVCIGAMLSLSAATIGVTDIESDQLASITPEHIQSDYQFASAVGLANMIGLSQIINHSPFLTESFKVDLSNSWAGIELVSINRLPEKLEQANRRLEGSVDKNDLLFFKDKLVYVLAKFKKDVSEIGIVKLDDQASFVSVTVKSESIDEVFEMNLLLEELVVSNLEKSPSNLTVNYSFIIKQ